MSERQYHTVRYEVADGIGTLTIDRPERRNAMTTEMVAEVRELLEDAARDRSLRILVLTGSGTTFCPGADIHQVAAGEDSSGGRGSDIDDFQVPALLHRMPAVTVARINGACAGAGFGWACGCDLRIATRSAKFNTAFIEVGVAGDMALPWSLPRLIGAARARELMFLAEKFDADEAHRIGLVARVFDDDEFAAASDRILQRLAGFSPPALRSLKRNFLDAEVMTMERYLDAETERHLRLFQLEDTREAFAARVEKRAPRWTGR